jgi:SNF2 family DNA or RNA helicase
VVALFNAARLSLRSGAAPFRSLGRISVTPRPYQFVPLIMALRLDPVRLLIADDVGVGKTIESGMIARELLDRGIARRLAVLTPAHLCDQWERELREKFAIETVLIQPSQMARLERERSRQDISIYGYYPNFIASIDFVKSDRGGHRDAFLRDAPDLIVVDEAHIAARPRGADGRVEHSVTNFCAILPRTHRVTSSWSQLPHIAESRRASAHCSVFLILIWSRKRTERSCCRMSFNGVVKMWRNG